MKEAFRKKVMARFLLNSQIQNKVTCDLPEQKAYYDQNLAKLSSSPPG